MYRTTILFLLLIHCVQCRPIPLNNPDKEDTANEKRKYIPSAVLEPIDDIFFVTDPSFIKKIKEMEDLNSDVIEVPLTAMSISIEDFGTNSMVTEAQLAATTQHFGTNSNVTEAQLAATTEHLGTNSNVTEVRLASTTEHFGDNPNVTEVSLTETRHSTDHFGNSSKTDLDARTIPQNSPKLRKKKASSNRKHSSKRPSVTTKYLRELVGSGVLNSAKNETEDKIAFELAWKNRKSSKGWTSSKMFDIYLSAAVIGLFVIIFALILIVVLCCRKRKSGQRLDLAAKDLSPRKRDSGQRLNLAAKDLSPRKRDSGQRLNLAAKDLSPRKRKKTHEFLPTECVYVNIEEMQKRARSLSTVPVEVTIQSRIRAQPEEVDHNVERIQTLGDDQSSASDSTYCSDY